ncbi:MAG TPA: sugar phosphate isomerase/epimerase family protein [Bryobacteraceae bacterium]|nr:sugar phosphate isomerase/epimerase family protein [Bryobacteraceae bacterium]
MKFGANTLIWTAAFDRTYLSLLPRIKERGFDGVEIARFDFHDFPAAEIRRNLEQNGLECTFCSALTGDLSLISEDAAVRKKAADFLQYGIRTAAELGARIFMGPFYSQVGYLAGRRRTADEWTRAVEGLQSLGESLAANGVVITIEPLNRFETYFLNTAADAAALCDEVDHPNVGIALDTFHGNIEEKDLGSAFRTAGKHLKHVHACENDRGIPGSGHVDWRGVFGALHELRYDGWLVIESFGFTIKEIAAAACIWRDLAPSPEDIAFEGLKFLKNRAA